MRAPRHELLDGTPRSGRVATTLVVPGVSLGGPSELSAGLLQRLIDGERAGAHVVLLAAASSDLDAPVAQVVRHVVTAVDTVAREASARYGAERVVRTPHPSRLDSWLGHLPQPESMTLRRRVRRLLRSIPLVAATADRLGGRR